MAENSFLSQGYYGGSAGEIGHTADPAIELLRLIDILETLVGAAFRIPWTDKVLLDREELLDLIDQLRVALPDDVHEAREVLRGREEMLAGAREEAEEIRRRAHDEAMARLSNTDQVKAAQALARDIVSQAEQEAASRRREANVYALGVLSRLDSDLSGHLSTIRGGVRALQTGLNNGNGAHEHDDGAAPE